MMTSDPGMLNPPHYGLTSCEDPYAVCSALENVDALSFITTIASSYNLAILKDYMQIFNRDHYRFHCFCLLRSVLVASTFFLIVTLRSVDG